MKTFLKRARHGLVWGLFSFLLAGCGAGGAGGGTSSLSPLAQDRRASTLAVSTAATKGNVSFAIGYTPRPKPALGTIKPQYISVSTQSLQILTDGANAVIVDLSPTSPTGGHDP